MRVADKRGAAVALNAFIDRLRASLVNGPTISSATTEQNGRLVPGTTPPGPPTHSSPADMERIELETASVGGSGASWAPRCATGLDLPQRKSTRRVCINTTLPPPPVPRRARPTCSTCALPGLPLAQTAAGTFKCGPGRNSPKVGF